MSLVSAAGRPLKANPSTRSMTLGSPNTAKACSREAIASTTAQLQHMHTQRARGTHAMQGSVSAPSGDRAWADAFSGAMCP